MRRFISVLVMSLVLSFTLSSSCSAVTIDNDGSVRENPYGDSKLPASYDAKYYDCYLPYKLSNQEVGGCATGTSWCQYSTYNAPMSQDDRNKKVGTKVNYEGSALNCDWQHRLTTQVNAGNMKWSYEEDTGCTIFTDKNGNKFYGSATQYFFSNNKDWSGRKMWGAGDVGQIFDVILTDGTVIHFIKCDDNAQTHTNGNFNNENSRFDVAYTMDKLNYPQYRYLFQAQGGNCIEIWGSSGSCTSKFMNKYNLKPDGSGACIAYYRVYDLMIGDLPKRNEGVGTEASFSLGNTNISSNGQTTGDNKGTKLIGEYDLVGMSNFKSKLSDNGAVVELPDYNSLSSNERENVTAIKSNNDEEKKNEVVSAVRASIVVLGILMMLYIVLLWLAYAFDTVNTVFDFEILKLLTIGRVSIIAYSVSEKSVIKVLIRDSLILFIVAVLLISGGVYNIVQVIFNIIRGVL